MTKQKAAKLESTLVGVAGEYFVAAELSVRGYIASITLKNTRGIDILASNAEASRTASIQVKTNSGGEPMWLLSEKSESFESEDHFYIFVVLKELGQRPDFYVVPSKVVAEFVRSSHANWLAGTKIDGSPRKDTSMRKFVDMEEKYKECWEVLGL